MISFAYIWTHKSPAEKTELAKFCGVTKNYLGQIAHGHRRPGYELANRLNKHDPRLTTKSFWQ